MYKNAGVFRHLARMRSKNDRRILNAFGNNLKRHRKAKGMSIRQFAAVADLDHTMIDRYERGETNPSILVVYKLADALDILPHQLLP